MEERTAKEIFASNLRHYLEEKGYRQADLARIIKVSSGTVADWCMARSYPRMDKVETIANFLGIQKSDLIEERSTKPNNDFAMALNDIARDLHENPGKLQLYLKIKNLSPMDREIVEALINNLEGRNK